MDTDKYSLKLQATKNSQVPIIGWTGSYSTIQHLDTLRTTLRRLAARERFRLRVIGPTIYQLDGVDVETVSWRSASEVEDLRKLDIGIMPLPDNIWTRGKCGCKALQYMALGIPCVCSPVGVNTEIIKDGENGCLASTEDEWIAKLTALLRSQELREKLGLAGRGTVATKYSAAVQAPRFFDVLQSCVKDGGRSSRNRNHSGYAAERQQRI
jgi:glycosyltransferase involved in cell wall biosynthesis